MKDILNNPDKYSELIKCLNEERLPLKIKYENVLKYYEDLIEKFKDKNTSKLIDLLD
ncbi:MAG: hypothetical protein ACPKOI_04585 [Pleomorphochaeta sp.]